MKGHQGSSADNSCQLTDCLIKFCYVRNPLPTETAGKWWKCDPISEHPLWSSRRGLAMNLVGSADERVLSGRCAVVICVMGCLRGLVVLH